MITLIITSLEYNSDIRISFYLFNLHHCLDPLFKVGLWSHRFYTALRVEPAHTGIHEPFMN